ncbi:MAG: LamG-like jellyroll fold domain-containing protein [Candidatus Omnitrophota bacterium]
MERFKTLRCWIVFVSMVTFFVMPAMGVAEDLTKPFVADEDTFLLYQFNEGEGTVAKDSSPTGENQGEIKGARWVDGKFGKSLEWGEEEGFVSSNTALNDRKNMTEITLQAWIYPTKKPVYGDGRSPFSSGLVIRVEGARLILWEAWPESLNILGILSMEDDKGDPVGIWVFKERYSGGPIKLNEWVHITLSASIPAKKAILFVNGVIAGSAELPANACAFGCDPEVKGHAFIRSHDGWSRFVGKIDSVMASAKFTTFGQPIYTIERPYSHFLWSGYRLFVLPGQGPAALYNSFKVSVVSQGDEKPLLEMTIPKSEFEKGRIMDYSSLPFGPYRVKVVGVTQKGEEILLNLTPFKKIERKEKKVHITDDGVTYFWGKPFFPVVLYHVRPRFFQIVKEAGFNVVHPQVKDDVNLSSITIRDWKKWGDYEDSLGALDLAEKLGLGCFLVPHLARISEFAEKYGKKRAYLSYCIGDEVGGGLSGALKLNHSYHEIRAVDPETPVSYNHNVPPEMNAYSPASDIVGMDPYPILIGFSGGQGHPLPLRIVADYTDITYDSVGGKKPVWMTLETTTYRKKNGDFLSPLPTYDQIRSMSYMALARGARGLQYYAFDDSYGESGFHLMKDFPESWESLKKLVKELNGLSNVWTAPWGKASLSDPSDQIITARHDFVLKGKHYLLVVNPLSEEVSTELKVIGLSKVTSFEDEFTHQRWTVKNNKFQVKMPPLEVLLLVTGVKNAQP